ncbi:hypothetical protein SLS63_009052 [Diaporthe eres]|uniref:Uncharacterized protein n=1 Tax=Diaporthe eres TaxID=83184 RepID=A0ABR1P0Y4_DIAER
MVRKTTKDVKRVQETTAEVISRLSDYLGSTQVINETGIQDEGTGGSNMAPKKRKGASKRKRSPTPDGDGDAPVRETRARSRRVQFSPEIEDAEEDIEMELERQLEDPLFPDAESDHPFNRVIGCYANPEEVANQQARLIGCIPMPKAATVSQRPRAPSLFGGNTQQPRDHRPRDTRDTSNSTPEERLDWYMDAALKEVKGALRLAKEDKLRQADLWNLLTFGQQMYAGMKDNYGIDLNAALLEREKKNMGREHLEPEVGPSDLPWPRLPPRRCPTCSRVVSADEGRTTWEHPWNRSSFTLLFPQEDRYDAGGLFGSSPSYSAIAHDPWNMPMRQGTIYRGWA